VLTVLLLALLPACTPTCEDVCDKLVSCDDIGTERLNADECKESCTQQQELYAKWTDTELRDAFDDELQCLDQSECSDIAADVCYDDRIWSYGGSR
jgi:hypothetical protein